MSNKKLPKIIKEVGFDFDWSESKVWALDFPVEEIPLSALAWHFDIPFWDFLDDNYNLAPNQVISDPVKFEIEYSRTMKADLSHPIDIMKNKDRWLILDGLHRLVKAKILGYNKVSVRKIPRTEISKIQK
ncbi:MAG: ParB N-terminal domain-containing protein [Parcubacteria group bacterium]|nr:ParB N-terminal domain-containing protein [Parcubacteria group bacterium]